MSKQKKINICDGQYKLKINKIDKKICLQNNSNNKIIYIIYIKPTTQLLIT